MPKAGSPTERLIDRARLDQIKRTNEQFFDSEILEYEVLMRQPMPTKDDGKGWESQAFNLQRRRHQKLAFLLLMAKTSAAAQNKHTEKTDEHANILARVRDGFDAKKLAEIERDLDDLAGDE